MVSRLALVISCAAVMLAAASTAAAQVGPPPPLLVNGTAEAGVVGWQGAGFGTIAYGDDLPPRPGGEMSLFAAPGEAAIWQDVDFSDLEAAIDQGAHRFSFGGVLGGRGGLPGGARLVAQPRDGAGAALGAPLVAGPPSERDRQYRTALLGCYTTATAPVGMRSLRLTIEAVGHALADIVFVTPGPVAPAAIWIPPPPGFRWTESDGPGCADHPEPLVSPVPASPAVQSLVMMPAVKRCGRALRFSVKPRWRSQVSSFAVSARGKRIIRSASRAIVIKAPKRKLRVAVSVRMKDGRRSAGTRTYPPCRS